jgi:hypothetical protein
LDQSFVETSGVKKLLTTVPVRKPNNQDFVRVRPEEAYRLTSAVIELKDDRETYLVQPEVARQLPGECSPVTLYTGINRQGVVFLWPVKLPTPDGRINEWHRSAAEAAERAMERWLRVKADMALGAYAMFELPISRNRSGPISCSENCLRSVSGTDWSIAWTIRSSSGCAAKAKPAYA